MIKFIKNYKFDTVDIYKENKINREYRLIGSVAMKELKEGLYCFDVDIVELENKN